MPEGYYSGDKPNPNLRAFVNAHLGDRRFDPGTDRYAVPAFDKSINTTKATAIYNMHTYWSKKPHDAIRQYISHYTQPGDLVLDPLCGAGTTALAALMEGRSVVAIDRSPAATFITKNYCKSVDVVELERVFSEVERRVKSEMDWLYETRCDRCDGRALIDHTVYSQVFRCPRCTAEIALFDCVDAQGETGAGKPKRIAACPHCYARGIVEEISTRSERFGSIPVLVSYLCENTCSPAQAERRHNDPSEKKREYFERYDLGKIREIEAGEIPHWYPPNRMMNVEDDSVPWGDKWRAGTSCFRTVAELYTKRNLWAVSAYAEAAKALGGDYADSVMFAVTAVSLAMSRMQGYTEDPRFPNQLMRGTYYLPQISREYNVANWLAGKLRNLVAGYAQIQSGLLGRRILISTQSATDVPEIPSNSVDYIFTDPPYGDKVQYGELNFVWEAWLGLDTHWQNEEIIVNGVRGRTETDWASMLRRAMAECYRVLKPGRWLSLCYHDTSEGTWSLVQDIIAEVGFLIDRSDTALFIDAKQKSFNQLTADKVTKRDLMINFRKPRPGETAAAVLFTGEEDGGTFGEKARAIIREYLDAHPGSTKDRVYDELVSRMVRAGQMERHNFDELLGQVAEEVRGPVKETLFKDKDPDVFGRHEIGRWYLKETALAVIDEAETAKEDTAAAQARKFIADWLKENPGEEGVHYSNVFEHYVYTVKDKPRRSLAEWLLDYFYKTDTGTYRLPSGEEEEAAKAEGRERGTNRQIKRYLASLEQGIEIPASQRPGEATLAEWIRHCKRSGMYEQGRQLYDRGGLDVSKLSERAAADVEEDYQVCVRMMARDADGAEKS